MPLPQPASVRDRTPEFLMLCERLQRQLGPSNGASSNGIASHKSSQLDRGQQIQNHSEFARKAAEIGHGIHKTSMKLQKLAQLAKRTSMFDDPAQEVDELTGLVKQDIQMLNNSIAELQRISSRSKEDSKQSHDHSHTVVDSLRTRLKDATQQFKDVLTVRTDNLRHHKERRQLFSSTDAEASVPLLRPQGQLHQAGSSSLGNDSASQAVVPSFMQSQQQLQVAAPQETYMSSRAEALSNVESTIVELGKIFNKLSEMVAQQGDMAVRIDRDIEDTLTNVTSAQQHILKYFNEVSSNRWLILKVFGVLLIFIVFFIMFIA